MDRISNALGTELGNQTIVGAHHKQVAEAKQAGISEATKILERLLRSSGRWVRASFFPTAHHFLGGVQIKGSQKETKNGCGSKLMVPFWGRRTTNFRTHFRGDWDVHWGLTDLDFEKPMATSTFARRTRAATESPDLGSVTARTPRLVAGKDLANKEGLVKGSPEERDPPVGCSFLGGGFVLALCFSSRFLLLFVRSHYLPPVGWFVLVCGGHYNSGSLSASKFRRRIPWLVFVGRLERTTRLRCPALAEKMLKRTCSILTVFTAQVRDPAGIEPATLLCRVNHTPARNKSNKSRAGRQREWLDKHDPRRGLLRDRKFA